MANVKGTAVGISAITAVVLIIASSMVGFAIGQKVTCFDFFGISKTCLIKK